MPMNQARIRRDQGSITNFFDVRKSNEQVTCIYPTLKGWRCSSGTFKLAGDRGEPIRRRILGLVGIVDSDPIDSPPVSAASVGEILETSHTDVQKLLRRYAKGCCCSRYGHRDKIDEPGRLTSICTQWTKELDAELRSQGPHFDLTGTTPSPVAEQADHVTLQSSTSPEVEQPEPVSPAHHSRPCTPLAKPVGVPGHHIAEASALRNTTGSKSQDTSEGYPWGLWTHTPTFDIDDPDFGTATSTPDEAVSVLFRDAQKQAEDAAIPSDPELAPASCDDEPLTLGHNAGASRVQKSPQRRRQVQTRSPLISSPFPFVLFGKASPGKFLDILLDRLTKREKSTGSLYAYRRPNDKDFLKIGYTTRTVQKRLRRWGSTCGYAAQWRHTVPMVPYAERAERLIHVMLNQHRYLDTRCTHKSAGCGRQHGEWFKIRLADARQVMNTIAEWMCVHRPYDREGYILEKWRVHFTESRPWHTPALLRAFLLIDNAVEHLATDSEDLDFNTTPASKERTVSHGSSAIGETEEIVANREGLGSVVIGGVGSITEIAGTGENMATIHAGEDVRTEPAKETMSTGEAEQELASALKTIKAMLEIGAGAISQHERRASGLQVPLPQVSEAPRTCSTTVTKATSQASDQGEPSTVYGMPDTIRATAPGDQPRNGVTHGSSGTAAPRYNTLSSNLQSVKLNLSQVINFISTGFVGGAKMHLRSWRTQADSQHARPPQASSRPAESSPLLVPPPPKRQNTFQKLKKRLTY